jgi:thiol-disulfide isomerase/thioredoxin
VFRTLGGNDLSLASLKGRIVVVTFTSYHCFSCRLLDPKLEDLAVHNRDVVFLDVSVDSPADFSKLVQLRKKGDLTQLVRDIYSADRSKMAVWKFGNVATPTMFVIDKQGRMASAGNQDGTDGLSRIQFRIEWARKRKV